MLLILHYIYYILLSEQERQCKYTRNVQVRSHNRCCCGKAKCIPNLRERVCVCVSARKVLVIQHAKRIHHIILSSVACLALPHFYTYKRHDFGGKKI